MVELALAGRLEIEFGVKQSKREIIQELVTESLRRTCKEFYDRIPPATFEGFFKALMAEGVRVDGEAFLPISRESAERIRGSPEVLSVLSKAVGDGMADPESLLSALEIMVHSMSLCLPKYVEKRAQGYVLKEVVPSEA